MSEVVKAMAKAMAEVGHVEKDGVNTFHKYRYASDVAIMAAVQPALSANGLILHESMNEPPVFDRESGVIMVCLTITVKHEGGEELPPQKFYGTGSDRSSGNKDGDKALYKALTGARKYAMRSLFCIPTGADPEDEKEPPRKQDAKPAPRAEKAESKSAPACVTAAQVAELREVVAARVVPPSMARGILQAIAGVSTPEGVPAGKFAEVMAALEGWEPDEEMK